MCEQQLMLSGLERQREMLCELIRQLEGTAHFNTDEHGYFEARTYELANNLKKLRRIKDEYAAYGTEN